MERILLSKENEQACLFQTVKVLREGGVVVLPTDTVYGLAAGVNNEEALDRVYTIKSRDHGKPLPVLVHSCEMLDKVASVPRKNVFGLLDHVWPGKVTCVLPARGWVPSRILGRPHNDIIRTQKGYSIGVRMPAHPFLQSVIKAYGYAITGTSANLSGSDPCLSADAVFSQFSKMPFQPDLLIDSDDLLPSQPSTVIDCTTWPPEMIREGAVSTEEIHSFLRGSKPSQNIHPV